MKQFSLFACTMLLLAGVAHAQTPTSSESLRWQTYTIEGEDFAVDLPVRPAMHTMRQFLDRLQKTRTIYLLGSYADGVVYTIRVFENPQPRQSLNDFIKEQAHRAWDQNTTRDLTLDGFAGKAISSVDRVDGMVQYFATKDRLYAFTAFGVPEEDPRIKKFFSSFSLRKKKADSVEVTDGPGQPYEPKVESSVPIGLAPPQKLYVGKDVDRKARLGMKPEPAYTEDARQNGVTGTVVLKCVFASNGSVNNIRTVSGLPFGLTERAIDAARKIKFIPAIKDGQYVSMWMQLEYNFNLY